MVLTVSATCVVGLAASAAAASTSLSLSLSQAAAFSILGHSCGGIREGVYATGFASATGYPTGEVAMSTRCGGSGRGGGGGSTRYTAWATVTWDLTTTVVSFARAATTPTVNPTLAVDDSHGNELFNQPTGGVVNGTQVTSQAYLVLAPGFVPVPRLTGISTTRGPTSGGTSITITGTGFTGVTAVRFGSSAAQSVTVNTGTSITAVTPRAPPGTVDVTVTNAGGTSATSAADPFTFIAPPTISGVSPNRGPLAGGNWVTVTGTNLGTTNRVSIGEATTGFAVLGNTSLSVYIPGGEDPETVTVTVTTIGGSSARTSADRYTYLAPAPPPIVTGVSPSTGSAVGGDTVTITGSGFTTASDVSFGGVSAAFTVHSDGSITAVAPPANAGTVDVTVSAAGGTSVTRAVDQFTYM
ncbi:MAG TPA: IPT/TIG domain-containing protein [Rugosimonospora sp.]|nr:IPT/TIG domain-containing protein [Rugosimonospora sp.]